VLCKSNVDKFIFIVFFNGDDYSDIVCNGCEEKWFDSFEKLDRNYKRKHIIHKEFFTIESINDMYFFKNIYPYDLQKILKEKFDYNWKRK
jgi:hypothetical protein